MRVVITRPRDQADELAELLRAHGAEPVHFPTIRIEPVEDSGPLDTALQQLPGCDWVIFTSTNAVTAVWSRLEQLGLSFPVGTRLAAIGPKTAQSLEQLGVTPDFVPKEFISDAIVPGLGELAGKRVMLPLADLAEDTLAEAIQAAGGSPLVFTAYHTLPAEPDPEGLAALRAGVDAIAFTSGSTARNFVFLAARAGLDPFHLPGAPRIACIGPKTAAAARDAGLHVDLVAEIYTVEGLVSSLLEARNVPEN